MTDGRRGERGVGAARKRDCRGRVSRGIRALVITRWIYRATVRANREKVETLSSGGGRAGEGPSEFYADTRRTNCRPRLSEYRDDDDRVVGSVRGSVIFDAAIHVGMLFQTGFVGDVFAVSPIDSPSAPRLLRKIPESQSVDSATLFLRSRSTRCYFITPKR